MSMDPEQIETELADQADRIERLERAVILLLKDTRSPHTGLMSKELEDLLEELQGGRAEES